ncbi:hypothetical protein HHK36_005440 [Tetracentron sinense]|uniref:Uncharacterized protein n=1 Tax=Tetracentron sinense TaxID=13715 RepID=A0A834ZPE5_TETSI|nr:hypothetical protein HHK36_005440 [Tetracentron sinense]
MSLLQYPDAINVPDLQIWNNAAFDDGDVDKSTALKSSLYPLQSICVNRSEILESDSSKENQGPAFCNSPVSVKSPTPIKPLHLNSAIGNSQVKPLKLLFKQGLVIPSQTVAKKENEAVQDDRKIDTEIKEIERGRIVPAKFKEQKQSYKDSSALKKTEEPPSVSARAKIHRRGLSLGPSEIISGVRSRQIGKPEITPIQSIQSRRKSCFWKLQEIDEGKVTKERGRTLSLSPKSRLSFSKIQASKKGYSTVGSKKHVKKDDVVLSVVQPKNLFKEGEKLVSAKKPVKPGRVVASRYNQTQVQLSLNSTNTDRRKRSLPENDNEDSQRGDKKRFSLVGKSRGIPLESGRNQVTENREKKCCDIPSEAMDNKSLVDSLPPSILKMPDILPRIRTIRRTNETPRDSGPAKRVAELIGRRSYFGAEEIEVETSVCQALSFDEEEE